MCQDRTACLPINSETAVLLTGETETAAGDNAEKGQPIVSAKGGMKSDAGKPTEKPHYSPQSEVVLGLG